MIIILAAKLPRDPRLDNTTKSNKTVHKQRTMLYHILYTGDKRVQESHRIGGY